MFIPYPYFYPSRVPDPRSNNNKRGEEKVLPFCWKKNHKIENYFIFEQVRKEFEPIDKELSYLLPKKLSLRSQKYRLGTGRDPGSEIWNLEKTYLGSRGQKSTGSRIRIRNTV
jgi:hypothetical protein